MGCAGQRISPGRHYFDCGGTILACFDAGADGDSHRPRANDEHVYFAVENLDAVYSRAQRTECQSLTKIATQPWGERSFYARDPFGNPICFVAAETAFTGE